MLLVPFDLKIVDSNIKTCSVALSLKPPEPLLKDFGSTAFGALAARSRTQGVHDDIVFDGTGVRRFTATNHRVGPQRKLQPVSGIEYRSERFRFVDVEQLVPIQWFARRQNQERTALHLPPQEVATTVRRIREQRPHEVMTRLLWAVGPSVTQKKR